MSTRLLPLSTLSTPGLLSGMPASSEVNSDWPSRISLGPAMTSPQPWPRPTRKDLDDRMWESVAAEREASVRSKQQSTSLADLSARLQQQLDSSRANDERLSQSLRQRQWTESQIASLLFPPSPSSLSAVPGSNASSSSTSRPALMSHVPAQCMPHLATEAPMAPQPQTEGHW